MFGKIHLSENNEPICGANIDLKENIFRGTNNIKEVTCLTCLAALNALPSTCSECRKEEGHKFDCSRRYGKKLS